PIPKENLTMASDFSRRSFLGGFLASAAAFLGRKTPEAAAASPPPVPPPAVPTIPSPYDPLGSITTMTYDACGRVLSTCHSDVLGQRITFTYDCCRVRSDRPAEESPG